MKIILLLSLFIFASCVISKTSDAVKKESINPKSFNENLTSSIINGDQELNDNLYLTKEELKVFMGTIPEMPANVIAKEIENYDLNLNKFRNSYSNNFKTLNLSMSGCAEIDWKKCLIDSSVYEYNILVPNGKDENIPWPESKNYKLTNDKMISCRGLVFISQDTIQYAVQIESWHFQGAWKFYNNIKAPRISRIK